jgi:hypothetical protein
MVYIDKADALNGFAGTAGVGGCAHTTEMANNTNIPVTNQDFIGNPPLEWNGKITYTPQH